MNRSVSRKKHLIVGSAAIVLLLFGAAAWRYVWKLSYVGRTWFLPARVIAPEGELSLFADYDHAREGKVPVYLVNRTGKPVVVPFHGGDIFLKQECLTEDKKWVRAESHIYSTCGIDYGEPELQSGWYWVLQGKHPASGKPTRVRYRIYSTSRLFSLVSNEADGFFDETERINAAADAMAVAFGELEYVRRIALKEIVLPQSEDGPYRDIAIRALGQERFANEDAVPILEQLTTDEDPDIARIAKDQIDFRFRRGRWKNYPR